MDKIISLNNGVSNAFVEAMTSIESGKYSKVINLLNYVKNESTNYDEVMVEYALLISYVNTGDLENAKLCIEVLDSIYIENDQIKAIVEQIKRDVLRRETTVKQAKTLTFEQSLKVLHTNKIEIENLYTKYPDDAYVALLNDAIKGSEEAQSEVIKEVSMAKVDMKQFINDLELFVEFNENFKPINLFENLNSYEADTFRWMILTPENIDKIYQNRRLPSFIRKYILERAVHYVHFGIYNDFQMRINGELTSLSKLPDFHPEFFDVVNKINTFYDLNENIYDMISSVLNIVYVNNYPDNIFSDLKKLYAIVGYIVNDIFVGRKYDKAIEASTGYTFDSVKTEIKNMELLITFLIS